MGTRAEPEACNPQYKFFPRTGYLVSINVGDCRHKDVHLYSPIFEGYREMQLSQLKSFRINAEDARIYRGFSFGIC